MNYSLGKVEILAYVQVNRLISTEEYYYRSDIRSAGLVPRFTGAVNAEESYVNGQEPDPDTIVSAGSTVTLHLVAGPVP